MRHLVITPAKNEGRHIGHTLASIAAQSMQPTLWIIVDDGSTDDTNQIVSSYSKKHTWIRLLKINSESEARMGGSKVIRAFNHGYKQVSQEHFDFISKIDADLTLPPEYFATVFNEFALDEKLGICGGTIVNLYSDGSRKVESSAGYHVRGALKTIRLACWKQIGGFAESWHWDGLDLMSAQFHGWTTRSISLEVLHHRPTSSAYNSLDHAYKSGFEYYRIGSDLPLTLIRTLARLRQKPFPMAAWKFLKGYLDALITRPAPEVPPELAKFIRGFQYDRIKKALNLKK